MIETALARAQAGAGEAFRELVEPYRDELQLPDQFLARRARVAIDHAFPACRPAPTGQVSGEADTASRSGAADFAD